MIGRLLATTALLAVLVTGATIGLEAVGLLVQGGVAPRQAVANLHTQLDPLRDPEAMLLRPLEALDRARARKAAAPHDAAGEAVDEDRYLADALRWAERYRQRREAEKRLAALEQPKATGRADAKASRDAEAKPARRGGRPLAHGAASKLPRPQARGLTPSAGPAQDAWAPKVIATAAGPGSSRPSGARIAKAAPPESLAPHGAPRSAHRARSHRASARRRGNPDCPFLGWLQTLL